MIFVPVDGRRVVADFDGRAITSNAGALPLGSTDRPIGLIERIAGCFTDGRAGERIVRDVSILVGQRVLGIAFGYEDLIDHDPLRHDPVMAWCWVGWRRGPIVQVGAGVRPWRARPR